MFSTRTSWSQQLNKLSELHERRIKNGMPVYDLTLSNPTEAGFMPETSGILKALSDTRILHYQPDPHGLLSARQAVCDYYGKKGISVEPSDIFLTASTSESYSLLLKLLCNQNDAILVPTPSYPLFEYLAQINNVRLQKYLLQYDGAWHLDLQSIRSSIDSSTRAIILLNPHNPTGLFVKQQDLDVISHMIRGHECALIVDEVFLDYNFDCNQMPRSTADYSGSPTFTLNGLSKLAGLPQMKIGWVVISGPADVAGEANARFEILNDIFLSANTPAQVALPSLLKSGEDTCGQIRRRVSENYAFLGKLAHPQSPCSLRNCEGGWNAILQLPRTKSDEEWAVELMEKRGIYVHPGYFYDFTEESVIVVSLLQEEEIFQRAAWSIFEHVANSVAR